MFQLNEPTGRKTWIIRELKANGKIKRIDIA